MVVSTHYEMCTYNMHPGCDTLAHTCIIHGNKGSRFFSHPYILLPWEGECINNKGTDGFLTFKYPFYWHRLTLISAWITNHMPSKVLDEITYLFPNFYGGNISVWEWMINYIPHSIMDVISYPCSDWSLSISEKGLLTSVGHSLLNPSTTWYFFPKYDYISWYGFLLLQYFCTKLDYPDSNVCGANIGPTWVLSAPDGPHVGPMNLAIRVIRLLFNEHCGYCLEYPPAYFQLFVGQ